MLPDVDGLTGSFFVIDESSGEALSVGVWESIEQAQAFTRSDPYATLVKLFDDLKTESPSRTLYEIADVDRLDFGGVQRAAQPSEEAQIPVH